MQQVGAGADRKRAAEGRASDDDTRSFFFAGDLNRRGDGQYRGIVIEAMASASAHSNVVSHHVKYGQHETADLTRLSAEYAEHMRTARYCLVPAGDTRPPVADCSMRWVPAASQSTWVTSARMGCTVWALSTPSAISPTCPSSRPSTGRLWFGLQVGSTA